MLRSISHGGGFSVVCDGDVYNVGGWGSIDCHRDVCSHLGPQMSLLNGVWGEKAILRVSWLIWPQNEFYGRMGACNGHYTGVARELINFANVSVDTCVHMFRQWKGQDSNLSLKYFILNKKSSVRGWDMVM